LKPHKEVGADVVANASIDHLELGKEQHSDFSAVEQIYI
jgi:hypothetical protein